MSPKYGCLLLCLFAVCGAAAQQPDDEYYPYAPVQEERMPLLLTDSTLFYRAVQAMPDLYAEYTAFNLPYVAVKRRGQDYRAEAATVDGLGIPSRYFPALRLLGAQEESSAGVVPVAGITGRTAVSVCSGFRTSSCRRPAAYPFILPIATIWPGRSWPSRGRWAGDGAEPPPSTPARGATCMSRVFLHMR